MHRVTTIPSGFHLTKRSRMPHSAHTSAALARCGLEGKTSMAKTGKNDPAALSALPAGASVTAPRSEGPRPSRKARGLPLTRRVTHESATAGEVLNSVEWTRRPAKISGADGEVVFKMDDAEVPADWSQLATDVAVSKYFRKAGVPTKSGAEESVRQLVRRVAHTLRRAGETQGGYFATPADAEAFEAELSYYLVHQVGAFNSPVWFNCGLWHEYEIKGSGGNWAVDFATGTAYQTGDAYSRPQVSACFIQSCNDDLECIFNLVHDEARVFKYGSGSGTNFSKLRGKMERLSGGGTSSGLMSFLEVLDRAAGATKSGGITRRAAKMVVVDADHPEIRDFVQWKAREEKKVQALIDAGGSADRRAGAEEEASGAKTGRFDVEAYKHACRIFFLAQEIAVDLASYPTKRIAERSHQFRPLGLGYANLGTLLMVEGLPYDSEAGRAYAGAITAVMTGEAYALSADMAASKGPFQGYSHNRESMLEVMRMHRDSVQNIN